MEPRNHVSFDLEWSQLVTGSSVGSSTGCSNQSANHCVDGNAEQRVELGDGVIRLEGTFVNSFSQFDDRVVSCSFGMSEVAQNVLKLNTTQIQYCLNQLECLFTLLQNIGLGTTNLLSLKANLTG